MSSIIRTNGKSISAEEASMRLNATGLAIGDFSEAMHVFSLEFPFEAAIISTDGSEGSIRGSSQEITKAEAI